MSEGQLYFKKFKKKILTECIICDKVIVQCFGFCEKLLATEWNGKGRTVALKEISPLWYWEAPTQPRMNPLTELESCPDVIRLSWCDIKLLKKLKIEHDLVAFSLPHDMVLKRKRQAHRNITFILTTKDKIIHGMIVNSILIEIIGGSKYD